MLGTTRKNSSKPYLNVHGRLTEMEERDQKKKSQKKKNNLFNIKQLNDEIKEACQQFSAAN